MDKDLRKAIDGRELAITDLLSRLEKGVTRAQRKLFDEIREYFLDRLERDDNGIITPTRANRTLLERFDQVYNQFQRTTGVELALEIATAANRIMQVNKDYYSMFSNKTQLNTISKSVETIMKGWLGIEKNGSAKPNGYLDTIIKNSTIKGQIQDLSLRAVVGQQGWEKTRDEMRDFVVGNKEKTGVMQRYYRNYVYDTYSKLDRAVSDSYGTDLGMNFAIYEGGLIETSREFCRDHNGKVYHRTEIAEMKPTKAIPPDYNPFLDMGGYACRHHWNWIPDAIAVMLRPEAQEFIDAAKK